MRLNKIIGVRLPLSVSLILPSQKNAMPFLIGTFELNVFLLPFWEWSAVWSEPSPPEYTLPCGVKESCPSPELPMVWD